MFLFCLVEDCMSARPQVHVYLHVRSIKCKHLDYVSVHMPRCAIYLLVISISTAHNQDQAAYCRWASKEYYMKCYEQSCFQAGCWVSGRHDHLWRNKLDPYHVCMEYIHILR